MVSAEPSPAPQDFYHLAPNRLAPGTIIEPNFGPIVRKGSWSHNHAVREAAVEATRRAHFPSRPSRLESTFPCPTLQDAINWRQGILGYALHTIYRVQSVDSGAAIHITDQGLLNPMGTYRAHWADLYWMDSATRQAAVAEMSLVSPPHMPEVIIGGPIVVLQCMDPVPPSAI